MSRMDGKKTHTHNSAMEPYNIRAFSLEHKERYDIIIGEEWYIFVFQQVPTIIGLLLCHLFSTWLYFTLLISYFCDSRIGKVQDS